MLAAHQSQQQWLDETQGMGSYLEAMEQMAASVGALSGRFTHAEGWRRHLHLGFSTVEEDPMTEALVPLCWVDPSYEAALDNP